MRRQSGNIKLKHIQSAFSRSLQLAQRHTLSHTRTQKNTHTHIYICKVHSLPKSRQQEEEEEQAQPRNQQKTVSRIGNNKLKKKSERMQQTYYKLN